MLLALALAGRALYTPVVRPASGQSLLLMADLRAGAPSLSDVHHFVQGLHKAGATKAEIEAAFLEAFAALVPAPSPPSNQQSAPERQLKAPKTIGDAKNAFREAYTGGSLLRPATLKFVNTMIQTSAIWNFEYSRVFAVGLTVLCDTFLSQCVSETDRQDTRQALFFGLGLRAEKVQADAEALLATADGVSGAHELLAMDDFTRIAGSAPGTLMPGSHRYTYAFGVGLIILMQRVGETPSRTTIDNWCKVLNLECSRTLESDFTRPLSIDGIGRFSFETPGKAQPSSLESIGVMGSF